MRVGIAGAGIRGNLFAHSLALTEEGALAAICDQLPERAAEIGARFGVPPFADLESMIREAELDALIVATPDFAHRDLAVKAAHAGLHLMVEKPLATTMDDADAIRSAVRESG